MKTTKNKNGLVYFCLTIFKKSYLDVVLFFVGSCFESPVWYTLIFIVFCMDYEFWVTSNGILMDIPVILT
jgi:hypothetical protein